MIRPPWLAALRDPSLTRSFTTGDWADALFRWRRGRVLGWMAATAEVPDDSPAAVRRQFESVTREAGFHRDRAVQSTRLLERTLQQHQCKAMLLKGGAHLAAGRRNSVGRTMDDLDLLVPRESLQQVETALRAAGWEEREPLVPTEKELRLRYSHQLLEWRHHAGAMTIDMHIGVLGASRQGDPVRTGLWEHAVWSDGFLGLPAALDSALVAALHLSRTLDVAGSLRDLLDIHLLMQDAAAESGADWSSLMARGQQLEVPQGTVERAVELVQSAFADSGELSPRAWATLQPWLPPGPGGDTSGMRRRRRRIERWALRHSMRLRLEIGMRRKLQRLKSEK